MCGFVSRKQHSSIFFQQNTCEFELSYAGQCFKEDILSMHNKRVIKGDGSPTDEPCAIFKLNVDGTGLKINNQNVYTERIKPENPIKYLLLGQEHQVTMKLELIWDSHKNKFYVKERLSDTCVAVQSNDAYKRLVLQNCTVHDHTHFTLQFSGKISETI